MARRPRSGCHGPSGHPPRDRRPLHSPPRASPCAETALTGAVEALIWPEVARSGEKWGTYRPGRPAGEHPASPPPPAARAACPYRTRRPRPQRQGKPDRCSPASTGTRWTTRDGSPSLRSSAPSSTPAPSSRAGSTTAWRSTPEAGWDALADQGRRAADHRPDGPALPAVRLRRAPSRPSSTARAGSCCRPTCASRSASTARPSSSGRATTRRSGHPTGGTTTGRRSTTRRRWPQAFAGPGDLAPTTCASRIRSGSDSSAMEER